MMTRVNEMIDALNAQPNAAAGFSAKTLYSTGQQYGLTCKEVLETFLGKEKAISRGLYAAALDADVKIVKAAAKKAVKPAVAKSVKKATKPAKAEPIVNDYGDDDSDSFDGVCYIATPEEIAESYN
jgi:hypothetical protein